MKTVFECVPVDVCLPDYYSGDSRPWVAIPVCGPMTLSEIKSSIRNELQIGAIGGNHDGDYEPDGWWKALHAAVNRLSNAPGFRGKHYRDIPVDPESDDCNYAYFVFVERK